MGTISKIDMAFWLISMKLYVVSIDMERLIDYLAIIMNL